MSYIEGMADAPGGVNDTIRQVQDGLASSAAVAAAQQQDAHQFIVTNGHQVVAGHPDTGQVSQHDIGRQP